MSRPAGMPKTGGRVKGTPNKKTKELEDRFEGAGLEAFKGLVELTRSRNEQIKLAACREVCSYFFPKRKAADGLDPYEENEEQAKAELVDELRGVIEVMAERRAGELLEEKGKEALRPLL